MTKATTLEQFGMLASDAADYTDEQVSIVRQEIQRELSYTHTQHVAASVWKITHNLNRYPSVTVVDSAGAKVVGSVQYTGPNTVVVTFSAPFAGAAYLN